MPRDTTCTRHDQQQYQQSTGRHADKILGKDDHGLASWEQRSKTPERSEPEDKTSAVWNAVPDVDLEEKFLDFRN